MHSKNASIVRLVQQRHSGRCTWHINIIFEWKIVVRTIRMSAAAKSEHCTHILVASISLHLYRFGYERDDDVRYVNVANKTMAWKTQKALAIMRCWSWLRHKCDASLVVFFFFFFSVDWIVNTHIEIVVCLHVYAMFAMVLCRPCVQNEAKIYLAHLKRMCTKGHTKPTNRLYPLHPCVNTFGIRERLREGTIRSQEKKRS